MIFQLNRHPHNITWDIELLHYISRLQEMNKLLNIGLNQNGRNGKEI